MNKSLKILLVIFLAFLVFSGRCLAVNINMNLTSDLANEGTNVSDTNSVTNDTENSVNNTVTTPTTTNTNSNSATFSNLSSLPESELGLTNILNILLIAVGFVLILLAIAIFIRLKK